MRCRYAGLNRSKKNLGQHTTGAAAAALAGYLRDIEWQGENNFEILQGEDMGCPSRLSVQYTKNKGESIKVTGETRHITETNR